MYCNTGLTKTLTLVKFIKKYGEDHISTKPMWDIISIPTHHDDQVSFMEVPERDGYHRRDYAFSPMTVEYFELTNEEEYRIAIESI